MIEESLKLFIERAQHFSGFRLQDEKKHPFSSNKTIIKIVYNFQLKLRAWMGRIVCTLQSLRRHMRINLRGRKAGMSEERLHAAKVCSVV